MKQLLLINLCLLFCAGLSGQNTTKDSLLSIEVNFDLDSFILSQNEKDKVDSLLTMVPLRVLERVEIYGHTDSLASIDYNRSLSKRRVQSILAYLVYQGLDPLKVVADYYGEERPKYSNTAEERYRNRRCEVVFAIDPSLLPAPELKLTDLAFKKGDKIRIPNLNFVGNQAIPVSESYETLQDLVRVMKKYPDLKIELHGHVCCHGDRVLSVERAKMVHDFLMANGVDAARLSYEGYSNTQPLFPEKTDKEKALNRRVEIYVVSNTGKTRELDQGPVEIDLRAPVMSVKFFPQKGKLYPSGHFMLSLIAEMMNQQEGLFYEFVIFDNINDSRLTKSRAASVERALIDMKVKRSMFRVRTSRKTQSMPDSENDNFMMIQITKT